MTVSRTVLAAVGTGVLCLLSYVAGARQRGPTSFSPAIEADCAASGSSAQAQVRTVSSESSPTIVIRNETSPECPTPREGARLHPSDTIVAAADALPDLLASWDAGVAETLFDDVDLDALERKLAWMRDRVGRCGAPAPMGTGTESSARFSYVCEHGVLEAQFAAPDPDATTVSGMRSGIRDVAPSPEVTTAGETVTKLVEAWDPDTFEAAFADGFREKLGAKMPTFAEEVREELGACTLGPVDLGGPSGALFVLDCEHGRRTMMIDLDDDQRIRALKVVPLRRDPRG